MGVKEAKRRCEMKERIMMGLFSTSVNTSPIYSAAENLELKTKFHPLKNISGFTIIGKNLILGKWN